jgi:hypothetical protein
LQDEDVLAAHMLHDLDHDLAVGEAPDRRLAERHIEMAHDRFRERAIGVPGKDGHVVRRHVLP